MITHPFSYEAPATIEDAVKALSRSSSARIIAGGHSLLPLMKLGLSEPELIVDIRRIPGLREIKKEDGAIVIGALATHASIAAEPSIAKELSALADAASAVGDRQVRSRGTIGGSLSHADPAADEPAPTLAFDATIRVIGPRGQRDIPARDFFKSAFETALSAGEIVSQIRFPVPGGRRGSAYAKFPHPASRFAVVGVAAVVTLKQDGTIERAALGITGAADAPFRATAAEKAIVGTRGDAQAIAAAAAKAAEGVMTLSDLVASSDFRKNLIEVHTRRALRSAIERATA
jgi:carbon-monoxide dehydrogenase medium subunit